jgi:hypothetical protein
MDKSQNAVCVGAADDSQGVPNTYPLTSLPAAENPSEGDLETLRRVGGKIQVEAWLVAWFSTTERFAFYALQAPLRKYTTSYRQILDLTIFVLLSIRKLYPESSQQRFRKTRSLGVGPIVGHCPQLLSYVD